MFKNRNLNLAIMFSTAWHLFWMTAIGVIVTPSVQPSNIYQEVGFLGPILEKTAFDLMVEEVKPQTETLYSKSTLFLDKIYLKPRGPKRKVLKEFTSGPVVDTYARVEILMKGAKETPFLIPSGIRPTYIKTDRDGKPFLLEGPIREREIIFRPSGLKITPGLYGDQDEYKVKIKFFVANDGMVYDLKPVVSSGYPGIDILAIRHIKRWRFSPLSFVEKDKRAVWGAVTFKVVAR